MFIGLANGFQRVTLLGLVHRNRGINIEREDVWLLLLLLSLAVMKNKIIIFNFFTTQILGAVAADFLYKSVPGLHSFSMCILRSLWTCDFPGTCVTLSFNFRQAAEVMNTF